jgi:hypothetical protein
MDQEDRAQRIDVVGIGGRAGGRVVGVELEVQARWQDSDMAVVAERRDMPAGLEASGRVDRESPRGLPDAIAVSVRPTPSAAATAAPPA